MTYRDDGDALRQRVKLLEARLQEADRTIAELKGEAPSGGSTGAPVAKAFTPLRLDRQLDFAVSESGYSAIEALLAARMPVKVPSARADGALRWSAPGLELKVEPTQGGGTAVSLIEDLAPFRRSMMLTGLSLMLTIGAVIPLVLNSSQLSTTLGAVALVMALAAVPLVLFLAKRRRKQLIGVFDTAVVLASDHRISNERARVRDADAREVAAEQEATELDGDAPARVAERSD